MDVQPLQERQLFQMKRESLETRIRQYYEETQNADVVIEYGMALLVRNAMMMEDYSLMCKDLIRQIFLTCRPSERMREFCLYFYDYFEYEEWEIVRSRLFKSRAEFSEMTRLVRPDMKYFRVASTPTFDKFDEVLAYAIKSWSGKSREKAFEEKEDFYFSFKAVFEDDNGKKHKLTFSKNADICKSCEELFTLMEILTRLTIFQKNGVRRFRDIVETECESIVSQEIINHSKRKKRGQELRKSLIK